MAWLRKNLSKTGFLTIVGVWNASVVYIGSAFAPDAALLTFITVVGNLIIGFIGVESGHAEEKDSKATD